MKDIIFVLLIALMLTNCNNEKSNASITLPTPEMAFDSLDLRPFSLPGKLFFPTLQNHQGNFQVLHEIDGFEWEIWSDTALLFTLEDGGDIDLKQYYLDSIQRTPHFLVEKESDSLIIFKNTENQSRKLIRLTQKKGIMYGLVTPFLEGEIAEKQDWLLQLRWE